MAAAFIGLMWADWRLDAWSAESRRPSGLLFACLVGVLVLGGSVELFRLVRAKGFKPMFWTGALAAAALAISPFVEDWLKKTGQWSYKLVSLPVLVTAFAVMGIFAVQAAFHRTTNAIANIAATLLGVAYLGGLGLFIVQMRMEYQTAGLLAYLLVVKFTDIGAWAAGMSFGKHKMIPWLSPGKSWEGLAGGVAAAILVSCLFALSTWAMGCDFRMSWSAAILFGLILAPAGQCGDLAESLLKRDGGVKDSGTTIPGFGGLLDVLDSPLGAAPVGYLLLVWLAR
jgi:phosphatidate cytidylyltransferase